MGLACCTFMRNDLNFMKINGSMSSRSTIFAIIDPTHLFNMDETEFSTSVALLAALTGYTIRSVYLFIPHVKCNHVWEVH